MSISAVKDKRKCVCVCFGRSQACPVRWSERQRQRLRVKLTAASLVQGQRAQTNLISDGCLSDSHQTVTPHCIIFQSYVAISLLEQLGESKDNEKFRDKMRVCV